MSQKQKPKKLVITALFTALICAATYIHIPTPGGGYIHPADGIILISAWSLGPIFGGIAAGIGSALADLIAGYGVYIPATLVIKALMAVVAALIMRFFSKKFSVYVPAIISSIVAEFIMVFGYFQFESIIYEDSAILALPGNLIQALGGIIISLLLLTVIRKNKALNSYLNLR